MLEIRVTAVTDVVGTVVERYSYTPYGEVTVLNVNFLPVAGNTSTTDNEHLYTGRRRDPEIGLQLNRNRFYAAGLGRWVNRDPIGYEGGTWNLYEYVNGDPISFTDHLGLEVDSVNQSIWQSILRGKWKNATDLIDDWLRCQSDPAKIRQLKGLKAAIKQMRGLNKWRKQMSGWSQKQRTKVLNTLRNTLKKHLKVRDGKYTPEVRRIQYQIKYLEKIIGGK